MMSGDIADIRERLAKIETHVGLHKEMISEGFERIEGKLDGIDGRLKNVEIKSATFGTIAGAITSLGMSLIVSKITGKV